MKNDAWVEDCMALLDPRKDWQPNATAAFSSLRGRARKRSWIGGAIAASLACLVLLLALPSRGLCATQPFLGVVCLKPAATQLGSGKPVQPVAEANYKLSGSPQAPVTLEIYSDYECPACAQFYSQTYPRLVATYVNTGKIRILHRDFPLPQHPYAKLAARYANAAGEARQAIAASTEAVLAAGEYVCPMDADIHSNGPGICPRCGMKLIPRTAGVYEVAVLQLFRTQTEWARTGNVDTELAQVLPPGVMQQVRSLVNEGAGKATIAADEDAGYRDNLNQTPTLIIVAKGKREKVAPIPSFNMLKSYLDRLLAPK